MLCKPYCAEEGETVSIFAFFVQINAVNLDVMSVVPEQTK